MSRPRTMLSTIATLAAAALSLQLGACLIEADDLPDDELGTSEIRKIRNGLLPECFFDTYGDFKGAMNRALKDDFSLRSLQGKQLYDPNLGKVRCGHDMLEKMAMLGLDARQSLKVDGSSYAGGASLDPLWPARGVPPGISGTFMIEQGMAATLNTMAYSVDICLSAPIGVLSAPDPKVGAICSVTQGAYMAIDMDGTTFMGVCQDPDFVKAVGDQQEAEAFLERVIGKHEALARIGRDYFIPCGSCDKVCGKKVKGAWADCTCPNQPTVKYPITVSVSRDSIDAYLYK